MPHTKKELDDIHNSAKMFNIDQSAKDYLDMLEEVVDISKAGDEGFNQGIHGYVDAKCKTCGIEFDSIPDMDDHYAMNPDHESNLNDLDNNIPNID